MSNEVKLAILKTFAYRDVFSYPLTFHQAYTYLISPKKLSEEEFKNTLVELLEKGQLRHKEGLYHFEIPSLVERNEKEKRSQELLEKAKKVSGILKKIPTIRLICVTGAVAAGSSPKNDDIDFFIVTSKNRLWITRFLVVLILKLMNMYRTDKKELSRICPNIFVDEENLEWEENRNVYTAHEILMAKPIFDRKDYYFRFLSLNSWVKKHLPHVEFEEVRDTNSNARAGNILEKFLMKLQLWYMRNKKTKEITTEKLIHFKRYDHSQRILDLFESKMAKLDSDKWGL